MVTVSTITFNVRQISHACYGPQCVYYERGGGRWGGVGGGLNNGFLQWFGAQVLMIPVKLLRAALLISGLRVFFFLFLLFDSSRGRHGSH